MNVETIKGHQGGKENTKTEKRDGCQRNHSTESAPKTQRYEEMRSREEERLKERSKVVISAEEVMRASGWEEPDCIYYLHKDTHSQSCSRVSTQGYTLTTAAFDAHAPATYNKI